MILSFKYKETERIYNREYSKKFPSDIQRAAFRKLRMINRAINLRDLLNPPGNHLEALKGNRKGQFSIRINNKWRICFVWEEQNAHDVEITDYH